MVMYKQAIIFKHKKKRAAEILLYSHTSQTKFRQVLAEEKIETQKLTDLLNDQDNIKFQTAYLPDQCSFKETVSLDHKTPFQIL